MVLLLLHCGLSIIVGNSEKTTSGLNLLCNSATFLHTGLLWINASQYVSVHRGGHSQVSCSLQPLRVSVHRHVHESCVYVPVCTLLTQVLAINLHHPFLAC